jgi:glycosyltransferase involved in cell wall biosynthesis
MATFNGQRFLPAQLESISQQTRKPDVLVISDDGSLDDTWDIAASYARSAPIETIVVRGPSDGLARNFWQAAHTVDSDLICWADQDDIWLPDKLERCERALLAHDAGLVSHSALTIDATGSSLRRRYPDYRATLTREPLQGDPWHVPSGFATMFVRSLVRDVAFDRRPISHQTLRPINHDHVTSLRAFVSSRRVELQDTLAFYRQHDSNTAGDPTPTGLRLARETVRPRSREFARLGSIAAGYGEFLADVDPSDSARRYFQRLAWTCQLRASVYSSSYPAGRLRGLANAARQGVYGAKANGGFGRRALIRDLALSTAVPVSM